jgi:hypothetical protein
MIPYALPDSYLRVEINKVDLGEKRNISIQLIGA